MRKLALIGLTLASSMALTGVAQAQYDVPATLAAELQLSPKKAGTKKKPANGKIRLHFTVNEESSTTIDQIKYKLPKSIVLDGTGFKTCTVAQLAAGGTSVCPKGSKIGSGTANALLGPNKSALDFVVTIFVASKKTIALYLDTNLLDVPIEGRIVGRELIVDIPENVYRPVGGLYSYVTDVDATIGKAKNKKKKPYVRVVGCKNKKHKASVTVHAIPNPDPPPVESLTTPASTSCKAAKKKK